MPQTTQLSVAVITLNEEKKIRQCLESVHDWADEVLVLDSFSKDQTQAICQEFSKVRFLQHPFEGHIQQKNRAIELSQGEWVLSIDADERVSPELKESILKFLASNPKEHGAKFPRLTWHMKKFIRHGGWYPNARFRLIRKGKAQWGGENPHDTLIIEGPGAMLKGDLIHLSFEDLADQVKTINYFSSIVALTRFNHGKKFKTYRLLLKPVSKFLELYLIKRGCLDGMQGFIIAVSSAYSAFLKEAKLYELVRLGSDKPSNLPSSYVQKIEK